MAQYTVKYGAPFNRPNVHSFMFTILVFGLAIAGYFIKDIIGAIIGFIIGVILYVIIDQQGILIDTDSKILYINPKSKIGASKKVALMEIISINRNFRWGVGKDIQPSYDIQIITREKTYIISFSSKNAVQEFEAKFLNAMAEVGNPLS